jgi:hypothetical protein
VVHGRCDITRAIKLEKVSRRLTERPKLLLCLVRSKTSQNTTAAFHAPRPVSLQRSWAEVPNVVSIAARFDMRARRVRNVEPTKGLIMTDTVAPEPGTPAETPERLTPAEPPERLTPADPPERLTPADPPEPQTPQ